MLPIERFIWSDRARMFYYWTRGMMSDEEYRRYKAEFPVMYPILARDNDRRALETIAAMGW